MEPTHFNVFDVFAALILIASGIFAFRRGLVREVMSLGTWVLASIFAFALYPLAKPFFAEHIKNEMLSDAAAAVGLFCLAIVILVPLGDYLAGLMKNPTLNSIDRSLGFVFGLIRGFLIMCLLYLGATFVWPETQEGQPKWLAEARTKSALAYGVKAIKSFVPEDAEDKAREKAVEVQKAAQEAAENAKHLEDISTAVPVYKGESDGPPASYDTDSRNDMDELLDRKLNQ